MYMHSLVPRPIPVFQCCTLKNGRGPGTRHHVNYVKDASKTRHFLWTWATITANTQLIMCALNASHAIAIVACHPLHSTYCCYSKYTYTAKYILSCVLKCHDFTMIWQFLGPKTASSAMICGDNLTDTIIPGSGDLTVYKIEWPGSFTQIIEWLGIFRTHGTAQFSQLVAKIWSTRWMLSSMTWHSHDDLALARPQSRSSNKRWLDCLTTAFMKWNKQLAITLVAICWLGSLSLNGWARGGGICVGRTRRLVALPTLIKPSLTISLSHVTSRTRPSPFSACNIEKVGVAWGRG